MIILTLLGIFLFFWTLIGVEFYMDTERFKDDDKKLNFKGKLFIGPLGWIAMFLDYIIDKYSINKDFFLKDK